METGLIERRTKPQCRSAWLFQLRRGRQVRYNIQLPFQPENIMVLRHTNVLEGNPIREIGMFGQVFHNNEPVAKIFMSTSKKTKLFWKMLSAEDKRNILHGNQTRFTINLREYPRLWEFWISGPRFFPVKDFYDVNQTEFLPYKDYLTNTRSFPQRFSSGTFILDKKPICSNNKYRIDSVLKK